MNQSSLRMEAAIKFVTEHPGTTTTAVIAHPLSRYDIDISSAPKTVQHQESRAYKSTAGVVERIIKDRHVRQDDSRRLYPWDEKRKVYAELLEKAAFAAPDDERKVSTLYLAVSAWRHAGDENRARILTKFATNIGIEILTA